MSAFKQTRECPFPDCDWSFEYDPDDWPDGYDADHRSEMHYEKEHAGHVEIQVTLERTQRIGSRNLDDIREYYFDEEQFPGWDIAYTRTKVLDEADDHDAVSTREGDS